MKDFFERLCAAAGEGRAREREPMALHTTFRTGGPARYFADPAGERELAEVVALCREQGMPYYILGNGSNLLVSDEGYDGVMIRLGDGLARLSKCGEFLYEAGAGLLLSRLAKEALADSLTGLEFAAGIPGTLGGAVVMNAGAYGGEMKDVLKSVRVLDPDGEIRELSVSELDLGYRRSVIPARGCVVLSARIGLAPGDAAQIRARMEELAAKRREKQPLEYPSAGSTFKRPEGYFAGKLIEEAGLRGFAFGGAQVSEKHCGFVINRGDATAAQIRTLCRIVQERVRESAGVELEPEVRFLGFDGEGGQQDRNGIRTAGKKE